jgi:DNA-binding XRE family transcriptional regulator
VDRHGSEVNMLTVTKASILYRPSHRIAGMRRLSERLSELRQRQGLSQADLAKLIGVTRSTISQLESGLTKGPKPHHLIALAQALNTTVDYLVHGTERGRLTHARRTGHLHGAARRGRS